MNAMKKTRKLLGLCAALLLMLAMGSVAYAQTYSVTVKVQDLAKGDILEAGSKITVDLDSVIASLVVNNIKEVSWSANDYTVQTMLEVITISDYTNDSGVAEYSITLATPTSEPTGEGGSVNGVSSEPRMSAEERWKNSHQNPDNYLPKFKLADGTEVRAAFPAHYKPGKEDSVSAVVTTMEDFCRILGITGGKTVHMNSFHSLCGEKMKQLMADYAALLGEQCSAEVTLGEIIELEMEVRDSDYNLLGLAQESTQPIQITICLTGKLKELSDTMDFAVVMWTEGEVAILKDVDEEPFTITIETTKTSGVMGIVYAPKGSFAGLE